MDFDEDMSGLQIEDLGEYFLQTDVSDNWQGFALGYTDKDQQSQVDHPNSTRTFGSGSSATADAATAADVSMQYLTSPSLSRISDILIDSDELGVVLGFGSPLKEFATSFRTEWTPDSTTSDVAMMCPTAREEMELANFSLIHHETPAARAVPDILGPHAVTPREENIKLSASKLQQKSTRCQNLLNRDVDDDDDDDDANSFGGADTFTRVCSTISSASPIGASDDDRGSRKKSREKMRRQEMNVKFEKLVDLLGLSNRVRKSAILHEAVSTITSLKRERDELRRDRDRLQQEVSKLATFLQYSHLGSVAAAMAQQPNQQLSHMTPSVEGHFDHPQQQQQPHNHRAVAVSSGLQAAHTHPLHVSCYPGTNCFPLRSMLSDVSSHLGPLSSSAVPVSGQVAIAPKCS